MSTKKFKTINRIKKAIAPLSPVLLRDIPRPQTVEEGRANLKRFYGCFNGELVVLLPTVDKSGNRIDRSQGYLVNGEWDCVFSDEKQYPTPHKAITHTVEAHGYYFVSVNVDQLNSLSDLYSITNSGRYSGTDDPSFTMNLIIGGDNPLVEEDDDSTFEFCSIMRSARDRFPGSYYDSAWLQDDSTYRIFDNCDPALRRYRGFYDYSLQKGFEWRWRQMNNIGTRYLHWLLLGPFAPYQFKESIEDVAA